MDLVDPITNGWVMVRVCVCVCVLWAHVSSHVRPTLLVGAWL